MMDRLLVVAALVASLGGVAAASKATKGVAGAPPPAAAPLAQPIERRLHSDHIDASSFLWNDWNKFVENYHPNYVGDDDPATAWVEGAKGSGAGEWLRIQITPLDHTTAVRLHIRNGYQKSKSLFTANARAKQVTVRLLPSKAEQKLTLADRDGWQDVAVAQASGLVQAVDLHVDSVYEGTKYEDLCISDVQVFATSTTPDNPAFEKSKHQALMAWRAARLDAAAQFKSQKSELPLYPAYEVTEADRDYIALDPEHMIEAAKQDAKLAKDWGAALAVAASVADNFDALAPAQVAPVAQTKLVVADGLEIPKVANLAGEGEGYYDRDALRLPMLDYVSTLFADRLRLIDVKAGPKVSDFLATEARCKADVTWVKRGAATAQGPAPVQAVVLGRCGRVEVREGSYNARAIELYVYDAQGRLALSIGNGHLDAYRWVDDGGRAMLAGGRALLGVGKVIDARPRTAVAAR